MRDYTGRHQRHTGGKAGPRANPQSSSWQPDFSAPHYPKVESGEQTLQRMTDALQQSSEEQPTLQAKTGIPDGLRTSMEQSLGGDFSNVKVHSNSAQAKSIGAQAYTRGNDIHFAPGKYNPGSSSGKQLLGHELAHVVQQRQGRVKPTGSVGGMPLNDSPSLEREADSLGAKAARNV